MKQIENTSGKGNYIKYDSSLLNSMYMKAARCFKPDS